MSRRDGLLLLALGAASALLACLWVRTPGYMDADYYYATARQIAAGAGMREPFLWNYLGDPAGLPQPSHLYWMPLTSWVAAAGLRPFGDGFRAAQAPFILLAALLPFWTAWLCRRIGGTVAQARLAGALAALSGFYWPFFVTTDAFALFALIGAASLWAAACAAERPAVWRWALAGALAGLGHLARADGFLLLLPPALAVLTRRRASDLAALAVGYLAVIAPWWARNLAVVGSAIPPGNGRALWLLAYDELFAYPAGLLAFERWWAAGWGARAAAWSAAAAANLRSLVAVNGLVFLLPLMIAGGWRRRAQPLVRLTLVHLLALWAVMTLVFPFAGSRGGYFHSSAAWMPILWALAPFGLEALIELGVRRRGWVADQARRAFGLGAVALALALTAWVGVRPEWNAAGEAYRRAGEALAARADPGDVVAVNNPPGFWHATGHPAVVIPYGDEQTLRAVVERYDAVWVVLDANRPEGLAGLYHAPASADWLTLEASVADAFGRPIYLLRVQGRAP